MQKACNLIKNTSFFFGFVSGACIVSGCALIIAEIILRSFFHHTLYVADEYTGYLMAVSSFLGLAYTEESNGHIRMELIDYLKERFPKLIYFIKKTSYILAAIFALYLTAVTWKHFYSSYTSHERSYQVSETLLAIPQFFLPLGSFMLFLQYMVNLSKKPEKEA